MNHVAVFIRTENADYYTLLIPFKNPEDVEEILLDRVYESPCNWCNFQVDANGDDLLERDVKSVISNLIEECRKDQDDSTDNF